MKKSLYLTAVVMLVSINLLKAQDTIVSAPDYLANATNYHYVSMSCYIGGGILASVERTRDGLIGAGVIIFSGLMFDIASWHQIKQASRAMRREKLAIGTSKDGITLSLRF